MTDTHHHDRNSRPPHSISRPVNLHTLTPATAFVPPVSLVTFSLYDYSFSRHLPVFHLFHTAPAPCFPDRPYHPLSNFLCLFSSPSPSHPSVLMLHLVLVPARLSVDHRRHHTLASPSRTSTQPDRPVPENNMLHGQTRHHFYTALLISIAKPKHSVAHIHSRFHALVLTTCPIYKLV